MIKWLMALYVQFCKHGYIGGSVRMVKQRHIFGLIRLCLPSSACIETAIAR